MSWNIIYTVQNDSKVLFVLLLYIYCCSLLKQSLQQFLVTGDHNIQLLYILYFYMIISCK